MCGSVGVNTIIIIITIVSIENTGEHTQSSINGCVFQYVRSLRSYSESFERVHESKPLESSFERRVKAALRCQHISSTMEGARAASSAAATIIAASFIS